MEVISWEELESRNYSTAGESQAGHEELISKYAKESET